MASAANDLSVVAVGETGLDYDCVFSPIPDQLTNLRRNLALRSKPASRRSCTAVQPRHGMPLGRAPRRAPGCRDRRGAWAASGGGRRPSSTRCSPGRWTTREPSLISPSRSFGPRSDAGGGVSGGRGARPARPAPRRGFTVPRPARSAALAQRARMGARDRGLRPRWRAASSWRTSARISWPPTTARSRGRVRARNVARYAPASPARPPRTAPSARSFRTVGLRRGARAARLVTKQRRQRGETRKDG